MPLPPYLRIVRTLLEKLNYHLSPDPEAASEPLDPVRVTEAAKLLRTLPVTGETGRGYLELHLPRLARTLALAPPPAATGRALELGCYMQITPFLERFCGYRQVRGAYLGRPGETDRRRVALPGGAFECDVDLFDAERDRFPYPDGHFDLVLATEIVEHMIYDPMHLLVESRRVLADGGTLLITTPNAGGLSVVAKALAGDKNSQVYSMYQRPGPGKPAETGHVREYTVAEMRKLVQAAGFEPAILFTTPIGEFAVYRPLLQFLRENGYPTEDRGEQIFCLAVKHENLPVDRYPEFLYT